MNPAIYRLSQTVGERKRDRAHERAVAVVPLPRKAVPALERLASGVADVEEPVDRVDALAIPPHEALTDVVDVNAPQLTVAVADGERHRRIIAPRAPRAELVRNARSLFPSE